MDPPFAEMEKWSGWVPRSSQVRFRMLYKMDDEDDYPFLEDDKPNDTINTINCNNLILILLQSIAIANTKLQQIYHCNNLVSIIL